MEALIYAVTILGIVLLAFVVCAVSDRIAQRRALKRLRNKFLSEPDIPDDEFAAVFSGFESEDVLEMRRFLAGMLAIEPQKIQAGWRFREGRDMRVFDGFIVHAFAMRYAPQRHRNGRTFLFPTRPVQTVQELFVEAIRFRKDGE